MLRIACALAATLLLSACPGREPAKPTPAPDLTALQMRIAELEARRGDGVTELVELATRGDENERWLALRGLGRIGGARARTKLLASLADRDSRIVRAAADAIGVLASLDELSPEASAGFTRALIAALDVEVLDARIAVVTAIGRAGDASGQAALAPLLASGHAYVREAAALAFGRYGRRKIELDASARLALIDALKDPVTAYGAAYAFAREHLPSGPQPASAAAAHQRVAPALGALIDTGEPATRAIAAQAIAKQNVVGAAHAQLEKTLLDNDWRVAVEGVRALAGDKGTDAGRDAVAAVLVRRFGELERGKLTEAHVVIEALRVLAPHARRPLVTTAIAALAKSAAASQAVQGLTYDWIECLAVAALARATDGADLSAVEGCKLPEHLRLPLVAELIGHKAGTLGARRAAFARLLAHADVRVRASAMGAIASLYGDGSEGDRAALVATLVAAIGAQDPILAGSAIDAAPALLDAIGAGDRSALDAAIVTRARGEHDPELAAAVLALVGTRKLAAGADACRAALAGHPVVRVAGASCLRALGEPPPVEAGAEPPAATRPPIELAAAFDPERAWVLETTRGTIEIRLEPEVAPWAVATIKTLTRKGFYDGLELHRVVPNFVVQGGDPTQSGWGGPGFMLPAEPSVRPYVEGAVGIADAGRDSGGSQWFVMHATAPHLDARYTFIGRASSPKVADALLIGDRVVRATLRVPAEPQPGP